MTHIREFREIVDGIYGTFLDARDGFDLIRRRADEDEKESILEYESLKAKRPELAHLPFGGVEVSYPRIVPPGDSSQYMHLHCVSVESLKERNSGNGSNLRLIGNMCLVAIYQYWDEHYRPALAKTLCVDRDDIRVSIFADLRLFRRAIIHHRGIATSEIKKCTTFKWFEPGQPILLTEDMFGEIVDRIFFFLESFEKNPEDYINRIKTGFSGSPKKPAPAAP